MLAVILLLLASFMFFLGANLLKVCYSIAEDPPNGLPSYELYSRVTNNALTGYHIAPNFRGQIFS